jgi:surface protein
MAGMFHNASSFNQPLNHFNTGKVTNMTSMFENAYNFNQPLNNWDVSNVTSTAEMFKNASSFLQSLSNWQIEPNTNTENMYKNSPMSGRIDLRPSVEQKGRTEKGKKRALEFEVELENRKKMPKTFFDEDEIPVCICGDKLDNIEGPTEFPIEIQQNPRGKPIEPKDVIRVCGSDATHFLHRGCAMSWKHSNDRHERSETQEKTDLCPICLTKMGNLRYTKTVDINEVKEVTNSKNKKALSNQKAGKQSCKQTRKYRKNKNKRRNTRRYK